MGNISICTIINSTPEICFDLSRSIDLHQDSMKEAGERAIAGITNGLIKLNEEVTWEATHFFMRQKLTSRITQFQPPFHFRDEMIKGIFKSMQHDHFFFGSENSTYMIDLFSYVAPVGVLGRIAEKIFLDRYLYNLLSFRNATIKTIAESNQKEKYIQHFNS